MAKSIVSATIERLLEKKSPPSKNRGDGSGETTIQTKYGKVKTNAPSLFGQPMKENKRPVAHGKMGDHWGK
jgi:hypothetical protein